ncbi:TcfC E-set like domain-containing protein [Microbulbifer agarilyticus]|uniref:TcfC E-set like domain-containing protein n=1 Tax=Microbulbifer agarilyticus TaxID=260552 RepID=UPI001CD47635|nr:TcfC E-set like domain-containing protein [Microbulbifer agarilyticus]MCA0899308.1 TcfC E-set like domain-containing protein [Microbulbifer agarilyticus]
MGFEELTEPTPIVLDVYFGGRLLSQNIAATVDLNTLTFSDPQKLFELLPALEDPQPVLERLQQALKTNSHLICRTRTQTKCGLADAEILEVIYNPDQFRANIFIASDYLANATLLADPFLPPATNRFAISQRLSGNWSGARDLSNNEDISGQNFTLFSDSVVSFGEASIQARSSFSNSTIQNSENNTFRLSELFWTRDYRGRAISAGLFQPAGIDSPFLSTQGVYGAEYYSSNNTRMDLESRTGTPIEVFMPVSGRVEVFRNEQLIHSQMLEAGNRLLSTYAFPQGSYDVRVVTYAEDGRLLAESQQFFAKDSRLPPADEWQWNLVAGALSQQTFTDSLPEVSSDFLIQAGAARRLVDNFGLSGNLAASENSQQVELGARWVSKYIDVTPSWMTTDSGRKGYRVNVSLRSPWANLTLQEARLDSSQSDEFEESVDLLSQGYDYRTVSAVIPLLQGRISARYSERASGVASSDLQLQLADTAYSGNRLSTVELQYPILRSRSWIGDMRFGFNKSEADQIWTLNFQLRQYKGRWSNSGSLRTESGNRLGDRHFGGIGTTWQDGDLLAAELQNQLNFEATADSRAIRNSTRYAGRRGSLTSNLNYLASNQDTLSYTGRFNTTFASDGEHFSWGGESTYNSSILVDIEGAKEDQFEILVNGNRRGYAKGGEQSLISVPAFENYDIAVRPLGDGFYSYTDNSESITLYPGNMASTHYEIKTLILVLGKLVRDDKPVTGATFRIGEQKTKSDNNGIFQLEYYAAPGKRNFSYIIWNDCEVPLEKLLGDRSWLNLGTIDLNKASCDFDQEGQPLASTH